MRNSVLFENIFSLFVSQSFSIHLCVCVCFCFTLKEWPPHKRYVNIMHIRLRIVRIGILGDEKKLENENRSRDVER